MTVATGVQQDAAGELAIERTRLWSGPAGHREDKVPREGAVMEWAGWEREEKRMHTQDSCVSPCGTTGPQQEVMRSTTAGA